MSATQRHGGHAPATWCDEGKGVALARLHSAVGMQPSPQRSACGRYVLCLDGTLYTRANLEREFATTAGPAVDDATLLLLSISSRGLQRTLNECDGAFALAVWDCQENVLWLARDRVGARPLYYGWCDGDLLFGVALVSLHGYPGFQAPINRDALSLLLRFGYIPAPHSIQQGIFKVAAGCVVRLTPAVREAGAQVHSRQSGGRRYWDAREEMRTAIDERAHMPVTGDDAIERLEMLLHQAVSRRTPRDAAAAAFLSGGTDSSLVTAVLQSQSTLPVDTFTVGFDDPRHDEADWADQVAARLGTRHTRHILRRSEASTLVAALPDIWCEPFADASQVPTLLASMLVADRHQVVMTGDGGDELFHGHGAYQRAIRNAAWNARIPAPVRGLLRRWPAADPERARLVGGRRCVRNWAPIAWKRTTCCGYRVGAIRRGWYCRQPSRRRCSPIARAGWTRAIQPTVSSIWIS
ncbi:asparagine synthase-related protein [Stenotrophomonas rhizophila]